MNPRMLRAALATIPLCLASPPSAAAEAPPSSPRPRPNGEIVGAVGGAAGSSAWPGDPVAMTTYQVGWRFKDVVAPYFMTRSGYAEVNDRSLFTLAVGVQAWGRIGVVRPYARASVMHQHEESMAAVRADPQGAMFGVGDGIRHRYGGELALGFDLPIHRHDKFLLYGALEAAGDWFPDPRGPAMYALGSIALGAHYTVF